MVCQEVRIIGENRDAWRLLHLPSPEISRERERFLFLIISFIWLIENLPLTFCNLFLFLHTVNRFLFEIFFLLLLTFDVLFLLSFTFFFKSSVKIYIFCVYNTLTDDDPDNDTVYGELQIKCHKWIIVLSKKQNKFPQLVGIKNNNIDSMVLLTSSPLFFSLKIAAIMTSLPDERWPPSSLHMWTMKHGDPHDDCLVRCFFRPV